MVAAAENLFGVGLYTPAEAALYARVPLQTMMRWLYGDRRGEAVLRPQLAGSNEQFVTFLDFVQAMHVRQIRTDYNVPLAKIRQAVEKAKSGYNVEYPFAMKHTTFLYGNELVIKLGDEQFVQVSGKEAHHRMIHQIVRMYMKDLTFDERGLANRFRTHTQGQFEIWMDPQIRFGEPLLPSCGYSARTLWEAAKAEGSVEGAARAYGVTPDEVTAAYQYYSELRMPMAA